MKYYKKILCALMFLTLADQSSAYTVNVDYQRLTLSPIPAALLPTGPKKTIKVVEFFSYGCPWCYQLDPTLVQWEKTLPANVEFDRVPVVFQASWQMFSKVFYIASALHVEHLYHANLFETVQNSYPEDPSKKTFSLLKPVDFSTNEGIRAYFLSKGVTDNQLTAVMDKQTAINQQMNNALALAKAVQISEIPAVIINGKYLISNRFTHGDNKKFIDTLNYLIKT